MPEPDGNLINEEILDRISGSMVGMALGDALGAHVEFRPRSYLVAHPVKDLQGGGTWGLEKGQVKYIQFLYLLRNWDSQFWTSSDDKFCQNLQFTIENLERYC